jgi:hypothetical protein
MASFPFMGYLEYLRVISVQHITADGTYKEDSIPEEYKGAILTAEVVHRVVLVSPNGELIKLDFDVPEAKDEDGEKSGGVVRDDETILAGANPTVQTTRLSDKLPAATKDSADAMFDVATKSVES